MMRKHRKGPGMEPSPELLAAKARAEEASMRAQQEWEQALRFRRFKGTVRIINEARKYDRVREDLDRSFGGTP